MLVVAMWVLVAAPEVIATDRLFAKPKADVTTVEREHLFAAGGATVVSRHFERLYLLRATNARAAERRLRRSGRFEYVTPDVIVHHERAFVPSDPLYSQQWHLENVQAAAAWDIAQGDESVIIAVVDSGVQSAHPDLADKIVSPYDAFNDVEGTAEPDAGVQSAHGTACAGIAAASTDNAEGIAALCPKCKIMPVKLMPASGYASISADVRAIEHAWKNGAAVISNSWGRREGEVVPAPLEDAINIAAASGRNGKGALVVFAAGNGYRENGADELPSLPSVLAIGASEADDRLADYSNFGPFVALLAPAAAHTTDTLGAQGFAPGPYNTGFGGTSAAAPVVSGIAGVLMAMRPDLTAQQVRAVLLATADKVQPTAAQYDVTGRSRLYGYGRVNMLRAVQAVAAGQVCSPMPEVCGNGTDDDCNGLVDALDPPCAPTCVTSSECAADKVCSKGHCLPKVAASSAIGAECSSSGACGAAAFCLSGDEYPGGYCTLACTDSCPAGSACKPFGVGTYCLKSCRFNGDCREGYACNTNGACVPACSDDAACADGDVCIEGRCIAAGPATTDGADPENGSATDVKVQTRGCRCGSGDAAGFWLVLGVLILRRRARAAWR